MHVRKKTLVWEWAELGDDSNPLGKTWIHICSHEAQAFSFDCGNPEKDYSRKGPGLRRLSSSHTNEAMQPYSPLEGRQLLSKRQLSPPLRRWRCDWCNAPPFGVLQRRHIGEFRPGLFNPSMAAVGGEWPFGPLCDPCMRGAAPPMYRLVRMQIPVHIYALAENAPDLVAEYLYSACANYAEKLIAITRRRLGVMVHALGYGPI